ncbi:MAG: hypothetical protein CL467_08750 [Acidimicrobiaceae bacterium]|nr:hypothetical protein [Acidimicrobiaceae bacterium]
MLPVSLGPSSEPRKSLKGLLEDEKFRHTCDDVPVSTEPTSVAVGLVLGAGGLHAAAQHAGVLAALAEATGWDARTADVVVGTSAGSTTAVNLRAGLSATDLRAYYARTEISDEGRALLNRVTTQLDLGPRESGSRDQTLRPAGRPANPMLLLRDLLSTSRPRPVVALTGLLPKGPHDGSSLGLRITELHPEAWPERPTWICTVDLDTGERVVLGRDDVNATIGPAVQASAAVPGWFRPVEIDGRRLVDGGVHSTTNADLTAALGLDLVIVSSSKTVGRTSGRQAPTTETLARAWHGRTLWREISAIRRKGARVLLFQPTFGDLAARSSDDRSDENLPAICEAARASALARIALPDAGTARRLLATAGTDPR